MEIISNQTTLHLTGGGLSVARVCYWQLFLVIYSRLYWYVHATPGMSNEWFVWCLIIVNFPLFILILTFFLYIDCHYTSPVAYRIFQTVIQRLSCLWVVINLVIHAPYAMLLVQQILHYWSRSGDLLFLTSFLQNKMQDTWTLLYGFIFILVLWWWQVQSYP